jgi:hypothetical protein
MDAPWVIIVDSSATTGLPVDTADLTSELTWTKELIPLIHTLRDITLRNGIIDSISTSTPMKIISTLSEIALIQPRDYGATRAFR